MNIKQLLRVSLLLTTLVGWLLPVGLQASPYVLRKGLAAPAAGYRYLRFTAEKNTTGLHLNEIEFLNGDIAYPKLGFKTNDGTFEAVIPGATYAQYQLFDKNKEASYYLGGTSNGESSVTLDFKDHLVYATGVRLSKPSWSSGVKEFRVEGTNDLTAWTILYESPENAYSYFTGDGSTGTFTFGNDPVAVDVTPPSAPAPQADQVTPNSVQVSWPAATDAGGIAGYEVFFNGQSQGFTTNTTFSQNYTLKPATDYTIDVVAYDKEFNASAKGTLAVTTLAPAVAQGYKYVRFWVAKTPNGSNIQLVELRWLMGERRFPLNPIRALAGDAEVGISSNDDNTFDAPFKAFDGQDDAHWYVAPGKQVTLEFKNIDLHPTGIEITTYNWTVLPGFRCEGSNDNQHWTPLYERSNLGFGDYPQEAGSVRRGRFDFGTTLPADLDVTAPSVPANPAADQTTATFAEIHWDASTDAGTGVAVYKVFVNGVKWGQTAAPNTTVYGLSPQTTYSITLAAMDKLGNESAQSTPLTVTTSALAPAVGAMAIGSGLGSDMSGVWKAGVNFADEWANYATANPFSQTFLDEVKHYKALRFMDMVTTNNNWIENWADRRQPGDANQTVEVSYDKTQVKVLKGVAVEWMIKLCNLTGADLWVNVPHAANDNYIGQLAQTIQLHLNPSLNVYIEYSNEVWGGFGAETFATNKGKELGLQTGNFPRYAWFTEDFYARFRYYVLRSTQMYTIFNTAFGSESSRVKKVLAGWAGQPDVARVHLDALKETAINPAGIYPDFYAIAPYFGFSGSGGSSTLLNDLRAAIAESSTYVKNHYAILSGAGRNIPLITYEGGQHLTNSGEIASRNPVMYQAYIEYLNTISPYVELLPHFVHASAPGWGMAWGAKEYVGQPELETFKYRALKDWQTANKNNAPIRAPYILEQPKPVTVAEGSGATFKLVVIGQQPMQFQWYENGQPITGATHPELTLPQVGFAKSGSEYYVKITNASGSTASQPAKLTVTEVTKALATKLTQPLTVDGTAEAAWDQATAYTLGKVNLGKVDNDADASGNYKVLWDQDYLYVLVKITDNVLIPVENPANAWNYDGVEVYLDATNDKTDTYNANDRQVIFSYNATGLVGGSGSMPLTNAKAKQVAVPNGYQTEIAFAWTDLGLTPAPGQYLGLDVMVSDNDTPGGNREGKKAWWANEDMSWQKPANFGTLRLEEVPVVPVQALQLTSLCSYSPATTRNWRITNPNTFAVNYTWELYGTNQKGSGTAQPGEQALTTPTVAGANTLKVYWQDENGTPQFTTKASLGGTEEPAYPIRDNKGKEAKPKIQADYNWCSNWDQNVGTTYELKTKDFVSVPHILVVSNKPVTAAPQDGQVYTASLTFGQGTAVAADVFSVRKNSTDKDAFKLTGLTPGTKYYVAAFIYADANACGPNYRVTPVATAEFTTCSRQTANARQGFGTNENGDGISLFPNPASDRFTVRYYSDREQQVQLHISHSAAGLVSEKPWQVQAGHNELVVATQAMKPGLYVVSVVSNGKRETVKLTIVK